MALVIEHFAKTTPYWDWDIFLGSIDGRVVALAQMKRLPGDVGITDVYVAEEYRGKGLGYEMKQHVLRFGFETKGIREFHTEINRGNEPSLANVRKQGYKRAPDQFENLRLTYHDWVEQKNRLANKG